MKINHAKAEEMERRRAAGEFATAGHYECTACGHPTEADVDGDQAVCVLCRRPGHLVWHPAEPGPTGGKTVQTPAVAPPVAPDKAKELFDQMRKALDP